MTRSYSWRDLYLHSLSLGFSYFMSILEHPSVSKEAVKRLLIPMDIARYFELPATLQGLQAGPSHQVLDLSSPKLLSLYLAERSGCQVTAVDYWREEVESWKSLVSCLTSRRPGLCSLRFLVADGRLLPFPDGRFDRAYSVSVVEHIPPDEDGDAVAIRELARVLAPGGRLVLTVPYSASFATQYQRKVPWPTAKGEKGSFWGRTYDRESMMRRLVQASGLSLEDMWFSRERFHWFSRLYTRFFPLSTALGLFFPVLHWLSCSTTRDPHEPTSGANAVLVLVKQTGGSAAGAR